VQLAASGGQLPALRDVPCQSKSAKQPAAAGYNSKTRTRVTLFYSEQELEAFL
jgi:hypothetical protein